MRLAIICLAGLVQWQAFGNSLGTRDAVARFKTNSIRLTQTTQRRAEFVPSFAPQDGVRSVVKKLIPRGPNNAIPSTFESLEDGANYRDINGEWKPTEIAFQETPDGFILDTAPYKLKVLKTFNAGTVRVTTPDNETIVGGALGLFLTDPESGKSIHLSAASEVEGVKLAPNVIVFPNVFDLPRASVRIAATPGGVHQDVIIHEAMPEPAAMNLSRYTRLEVWTEFDPNRLQPARAAIEHAATFERNGKEIAIEDERLAFGASMTMAEGRAFSSDNPARETRVAKRYVTIDGAPILIESVPLAEVAAETQNLPRPRASFDALPIEAKPKLHARSRQRPDHVVAQMSHSSGYVIDYFLTLSPSLNNYTFKAGTTYHVTGSVSLSGTTKFEPGAVIKYKKNANAKLTLYGPVTFDSTAHLPVIFTADDDDTVGEFIYQTVTIPTGNYAKTALNITTDAAVIQNVRIRFAEEAIRYGAMATTSSQTLLNAQILQCQKVLISDQTYSSSVYQTIYGGNVLIKNATQKTTI